MRWAAKAKDLPPPQQKPTSNFAVARRKMLAVVGRGVQIGVHAVGIKAGDGFHHCILAREFTGAATVRTEAGEEVGSDDNVALCGQLIGHLFGPVTETEDLVNENDHRGFRFDLGVDHEGLDGTIAVLKRNVLMVAGRCFEAGFRPVLRVDGAVASERSTAAAASLKACGIVNVMRRSLVTEEWVSQAVASPSERLESCAYNESRSACQSSFRNRAERFSLASAMAAGSVRADRPLTRAKGRVSMKIGETQTRSSGGRNSAGDYRFVSSAVLTL